MAKIINSNNNFAIDKKKFIHFCGIGGIGMSGIAHILSQKGYKVQGTDLSKPNYITKQLIQSGIKMFNKHEAKNITKDTGLIIHTTAVDLKKNPEIIEAKKKKIQIVHRSMALFYIMKNCHNIVITGAHGKTTTTSIIGYVLDQCKKNPTIIVGGYMNNYNLNTRIGSDLLVAEGDESDGSFLNLSSDISVVTNIDNEHMSHYKNMRNMLTSYTKFISNTKKLCILCQDDKDLAKIKKKLEKKQKIITYGFSKNSDYQIIKAEYKKSFLEIEIKKNDEIYKLKSNLIGKHNAKNIAACFALCDSMKINTKNITKAIKTFTGVKRRFSKIGTFNNALIIDDYAHHPTEIDSVLNSINDFMPDKKTRKIYIFQPHRYSRTHELFEELSTSLSKCDDLIINPIYAASEKNTYKISSEKLIQNIKKYNKKIRIQLADLDEIKNILKSMNLSKNDIIIFMGAGDISNFAYKLF